MDEDIEIILQSPEVEVTEPLVADYVLPKATASVLGGVKIGSNVAVESDGTISVPVASDTTAGVIKVGEGLTITDGVLSADGNSYVLPQATKTSLGGVYVDDALSTNSMNPVQNKVVAFAVNQLDSGLDSLSDTVGDIDDDLTALEGTVSDLSSTVTSIDGQVTTNTGNIANINTSIGTINNTIGTLSGTVTSQGNAIDDLTGNLTGLMYAYNATILPADTDNGTWSGGNVRINQRGKVGTLTCTLEGTASALTVPANDEVVVATIPDSDNFPSLVSYGSFYTGSDFMVCRLNTSGEFIIENHTGSNVTIDRVVGTLPIIFS